MPTGPIDLDVPVEDLTAALCDIASVSGDEGPLADAIFESLRGYPHLDLERDGDAIIAKTHVSREERVIIAGHIDTVPVADNLPTRREGDKLIGRGTVDMKGGIAVALRLAAHMVQPARDVTYVFYDHEEVSSELNGLGRVMSRHADWVQGDFAILMEPTSGMIEAGCNGTLRAQIVVPGIAAHSARWWRGDNAIHKASDVLERLRSYTPAEVVVDGLIYREGLNAVGITGGIAGNIIPDQCVITVNYRFSPPKTERDAVEHIREVFDGYAVSIVDIAPSAAPGLHHPAVAGFTAAMNVLRDPARPKMGWTDVGRFASMGIPAVNFGPGDSELAHADNEWVDVTQIRTCEQLMRAWLANAV